MRELTSGTVTFSAPMAGVTAKITLGKGEQVTEALFAHIPDALHRRFKRVDTPDAPAVPDAGEAKSRRPAKAAPADSTADDGDTAA